MAQLKKIGTRLCPLMILLASTFFSALAVAQASSSGTLVVGTLNDASSFHPLLAKSAEERWLAGAVFTPLFIRNENWNFECALCQKIPTFKNGQALVKSTGRRQTLKVTWEISKEAAWGDGTPVTSKDIRLAWEMSMSNTNSTPHTIGYKAIAALDLDAKNKRKFTITYNESSHDFMNHGILYAVPHHIESLVWQDSAGDWTTYSAKTLYRIAPQTSGLYNGAFLIKELLKERNLLLERKSHSKGSAPLSLQSLRVKAFSNSDALINDLVAGNIDLVPEGVLENHVLQKLRSTLKSDLEFSKRYRVIITPGTGLEVAAFNLRNPILIDRNIRWALAESIDRKAIASVMLGVDCCSATQLIHSKDQVILAGATTYSLGEADLKAAASRMKSSGWTRGADGIWEKDSRKLQVKIEIVKGDALRDKLVARLASDWTKAGFQVSTESIDPDIFTTETLQKARFVGVAIYGVRLRPGEIPQSIMHSRQIPTVQNGYQGQNVMGWSSQAVDTALTAVPWEHDSDARAELIETIFKAFNKDLPIIPLFFHPVAAIASTAIPGFFVAGHDYPSSTLISRWQSAQTRPN